MYPFWNSSTTVLSSISSSSTCITALWKFGSNGLFNASIGVTPIETVGQEFNPDFHNAVMQVESEEYESGIIAQEFMKGYMYKDTVVRHSMVGVVS